jgi:tRNA A-37 threonylcarbamoyl transferase component Bud32
MHGGLLAGRWRLGDRLGRGAVADVHEAFDDQTGERVAVKVVRHVDEQQRARFEREVSALESLDHPGIVGVRGHGDIGGQPFVVLECVDGGSLAEELAAQGPLPPAGACRLTADLADALDHAHQHGIVHRDVKPSNVLLGEDGRPRLADFGVAQLDGSASLTASGFTVGTAAYLAPEQVRGERVGPPADVYALGLLLLESLTGERAYPGAGVGAAMARLQRQPEIPQSVPGPIAERVRAMTDLDPAARPTAATTAAALAALAEVPDGDGTSVLPIVDAPTELVAVVPATTPGPRVVVPAAAAMEADPGVVADAGTGPSVVSPAWRSIGFALACFVAGFLLVLAVRAMADSGGGGIDELPATTVATTAPPTTAAPTTAAPPPPEEGDEDGNGHGNGRGRDRDD